MTRGSNLPSKGTMTLPGITEFAVSLTALEWSTVCLALQRVSVVDDFKPDPLEIEQKIIAEIKGTLAMMKQIFGKSNEAS